MDTKYSVTYDRVGYSDNKVIMGFRRFEDARAYAKKMSCDKYVTNLKLIKNDTKK